ncbi:thermosome subunit gamma [Rhynchospora pubera]|uniref:Thermosome subunit gamma n=1 Tax=Rhynchospora pubera TaxID=906938 RepID=A0AAV8FXK4_9POAL|nr:thermosome subunit gamma [Rhynchospora pubera]
MGMALKCILEKWWPAPLLPISYYAASRLLTPPDSTRTRLHPTHLPTVTREQFKEGHLINEFVRFIHIKDGDTAGKLDFSVVRYKERLPGQTFNPNFAVDLVSVVHVGDRQYYEKLQKRLEIYDSVIYEGLRKTDCTQKSRYFDDITSLDLQSIYGLQRRLALLLSLSQQSQHLKPRPSWKHGDLDWSTFLNLEIERKRLLATIPSVHDLLLSTLELSGLTGHALDSFSWLVISPFPLPYIVYLACSGNDPVLGSVDTLEDILKLGIFWGPAALKFWMAWAVSSSLCSLKDLEDTAGSERTSVLIGERNKVAIKELKGAMKRGEHSIAILYGAAHMPDFHKRLAEEFNLVPTSMDWITAWSIETGPKSRYIQPFLNKFACEDRNLILASLIFAILVAHISAWQAFGIRYWCCLIFVNFLVFLTY